MMKIAVILLCCLFASVATATKVEIQNDVVVGSIECDVCDFLVGIAEHFVELNWTESKILGKMAESCTGLLTPSYVSACKTLVEGEGATIINLVLQHENASVICAQINACTPDQEILHHLVMSSPPTVIPLFTVESSLECSVCEWLAAVGENYLAQNKTEVEVLDKLAVACDVLLDTNYINECKGIVENDGEEMIALLEAEETPEKICTDLRACSAL
eukprot:TRINITY_DN20460_c0_g1_i1.p1 TRINITY_DN20460_c0_g1~~TRINITY_DN20460_c0_g1_i1.p1  ORF type:complete len:248 (-),score=67.03 TRINITY_DN20460_c0_g1_i1:73-723(-)